MVLKVMLKEIIESNNGSRNDENGDAGEIPEGFQEISIVTNTIGIEKKKLKKRSLDKFCSDSIS